MSALELLYQAAPVYVMLLLGGLLRALKWMTRGSEKDFLRICLNVLYPALIIDRVVGNPVVMDAAKVVPAIAISFGLTAAGFFLARAAARMLPESAGRGTFAAVTGLQNYGYVALPVTIALFKDRGVEGMLFVFNLGVELALWTIAVIMVSKDKLTDPASGEPAPPMWRNVLSPPLIGIVIALTINATGLHNHFPKVLHDTVHQLGLCAIPLAVLLIGGIITELLQGWRPSLKIASAGSLLRLLILPAMLLAAARWLPMPLELRKVLLVQAAMPSAVFAVILARKYGGNPDTAVQVIVATTFLSLLSLPLILQWGMRFLGLEPG